MKGNLVSISEGSFAHVRLGDVFHLSRGDQYVGRIKITAVDRNLSVGTLEEAGAGAPPQPGDIASPGE